jgi:pantoate kinase
VTLLFAPAGSDEGSLGVSVAVADGVTSTVHRADRVAIRVDGAPSGFEPVEHALAALDVTVSVDLDPAVPIGCGFGTSGAATLATVLAADAACGLDRSRGELVDIAHRGELAAGTGLGDVFVQARGGLVYDIGDGRGRREVDAPLEYDALGGIPTAEVLGDESAMARIRAAADDAFAAFEPGGSLPAAFDLGWGFAREADLPTDRVRTGVERVRSAGGAASMAMLGETVVAAGVEGVLPGSTRVTADGARVLG